MKKPLKFVENNRTRLMMSAAELFVGVLLLFRPRGFTMLVLIALGLWLLATGLMRIRKYFKLEPVLAAHGNLLSSGLIMSLAGVFCVLRRAWIAELFPVLALLYGVILLLAGLCKAQMAVDR